MARADLTERVRSRCFQGGEYAAFARRATLVPEGMTLPDPPAFHPGLSGWEVGRLGCLQKC